MLCLSTSSPSVSRKACREDIDPDGVYVVSTIAAQALKDYGWAGTYMVTCGAIRDEQGHIIGCQGLARI